jgi:hypothetical protein
LISVRSKNIFLSLTPFKDKCLLKKYVVLNKGKF